MQSSFTNRPKESDVIKGEYDERVSRKEITFSNNSGATADFEIGQTLVASGNNFVPADGVDADGILVTPITDLANAGTVKAGMIYKGPVIVDQDALVFADGSTPADQRTALAALGITLVREPIKQGGPGDELE
jgi:hypothetical protein